MIWLKNRSKVRYRTFQLRFVLAAAVSWLGVAALRVALAAPVPEDGGVELEAVPPPVGAPLE